MRLCAIQCSSSDMIELIDSYNSVNVIKSSNLFDKVSLVAPAMESSSVLKEKATQWGVEYFEGEVENVTQRFAECIDHYDASVVLRILPQWFFLDIQLIEECISIIESSPGIDLIQFPRDFDIRFGGDACRGTFFSKALDLQEKLYNDNVPKPFSFNPWGFAEKHDELFSIYVMNQLPIYDNKKHETDRELMGKIWPEHWSKSSMPNEPYRIALSEFTSGSSQSVVDPKALDLACGNGDGTMILQNAGFDTLGVDIDELAIKNCTEIQSGNKPGFLCKNYKDLRLDNESVDLVVSVHTMEHVPDHCDFLEKICGWLRSDGLFVLEVPLLRRKPYAGTSTPVNPHHFREYDINELKSLVLEKFRIIKSYGVCRGIYLDEAKARDAALLICKKEPVIKH